MSKCAAIQMASSPNVGSNLLEAGKLIAEAAKSGAKLIALPENFAIMGMHELDKVDVREPDNNGIIQTFLAETAKKHGVWLVGGTIPLAADNDKKVRAACVVYNDKGERVARYDKIHLFDVSVPDTNEEYKESDSIEQGNEPLVIDTPFGRIGFAICYDLRFPEYFRQLQQQKVDIIIVPSAFTAETGAAHWEVLLRARAIENLCYIIAPNQGGFHINGRKTFGHSMIIDPWGIILDCHKTGAGFVAADIDTEHLDKVRASFPVLSHRRFFLSIKLMSNYFTFFIIGILLSSCSHRDIKYQDNSQLEMPPTMAITKQMRQQSRPTITEPQTGLGSAVWFAEQANKPTIHLKKSFARSWNIVQQALKLNEIEITDKNRDEGIIYVLYDPDTSESGVFNLVNFFLFKDTYSEASYQLNIAWQQTATDITVQLMSDNGKNMLTDVEEDNEDANQPADGSLELSRLLFKIIKDDLPLN